MTCISYKENTGYKVYRLISGILATKGLWLLLLQLKLYMQYFFKHKSASVSLALSQRQEHHQM